MCLRRGDMVSTKGVEDYLKALYALAEGGGPVSTTEVAEHFKIAPASVTEMLKKLAKKGYVEYSPYRGARLTDTGVQAAEKVVRKHRLLENFLQDVLSVKKDKVHAQACEMEHALSDEAEEALCRFLNHPNRCPDDGKIIPACDLAFSNCEECVELHKKGLEEEGKRSTRPIAVAAVEVGNQCRVSFIRGERRTIRRLSEWGVMPGAEVTVVSSAPFRGQVEILVGGSKIAVRRSVADGIFVEGGEK